MQTQEQELVLRAQAGDRSAVAGLYQMFADRLYRQVLYPCAPDPSTAEDLLKDTFITVLEQIQNFRWDAARGIFPWLARIARNRAMDRHRKLATEGRTQGAYQQHLEQLTFSQTPETLLGQEEETMERKANVRMLLDQLNPRYQTAIELRLFQERTREECAAHLGVTISTFDVLFYRSIRAFRKLWDIKKEQT